MQKKYHSLVGKFILVTGTALFIVLLTITLISVNFAVTRQQQLSNEYKTKIMSFLDDREKATHELITGKGEALVTFMAKSASNLMMNFDYETLKEIAQSGIGDVNIAFISFYDADGTLVAGAGQESDSNVISKDIVAGEERLGRIKAGLDFTDLQVTMADLGQQNDLLLKQVNTMMAEARKKMFLTLGTVAIAGIILLCCVFYGVISKIITQPIKSTVAMLKDIAEGEGDLTKRIKVSSRDEIGQLAGYFNLFVEKLQGIIKNIVLDAESLHVSAADLNNLSRQLSDGSKEMSNRSSAVAEATNRMNYSMTSVASAMEEATANADIVAEATEKMSVKINEIAKNVEVAMERSQNAVSQAADSSVKVHELGQVAEKIGTVTETISAISEQTNLLALNATIEAARAGESGKGFAVVANEIKELAHQTAEATDDIAKRLKGIQRSSKDTVSGIGAISETIDLFNEIVTSISGAMEQQSTTTIEISANITQTSSGVKEVTQNINQTTMETSQIVRDIDEVNSNANRVADSSFQLAQSSTTLRELADRIQQLVGSFRV